MGLLHRFPSCRTLRAQHDSLKATRFLKVNPGVLAGLIVALLIAPLSRAEDTDHLVVRLGQQSTMYPDNYHGLHGFSDEPISVLSKRPFRFLIVNEVFTVLMQGTSLTNAVPIKKVLGPGPKDSFDNGYAGIGAAIWSSKFKEWLGFYHAEDHVDMPATDFNKDIVPGYWSVALATSGDGYAFSKVGQIITSSLAKNEGNLRNGAGVGDVSACVDASGKYLYAYFSDFSGVPEGQGCRISMSRALLADGGRPGTWYKWYHNDFQEPGLGGKATPVDRGLEVFRCDAWAPQVTYIKAFKKYLMVFSLNAHADWGKPTVTNTGHYFAHSDDGINWSKPELLFITHCIPRHDMEVAMHPNLYLENVTTYSAKGWLIYGYSPRFGWPAPRISHYMVRRPITITLAKSKTEDHDLSISSRPAASSAGETKAATASRRLPRGAVLLLTFEENTLHSRNGETQVDDLSGKGHAGVVEGATVAEGKVGKGLEVGEGKCVVISGDLPSGSQPRTLAAWMKATVPLRGWQIPMMQGQNWGAKGFGMHLYKGGGWGFHDYGPQSEDLKMVPADGEWHHHCITYDGSEVKHYFDGTLLASGQKTIATGTPRLVLGADPRKLHNLEGMIDEVAMFDRALSSEEAAKVYQMGVNGIPLAK